MYTASVVVIVGLGIWLAIHGILTRRKIRLVIGLLIALGTGTFYWFLGFWGEMLWFDNLGYTERFWDVFLARLLAGTGGALFSLIWIWLLTIGYSSSKKALRYGAVLLGVVIGFNWGMTNWETILRFLYAAPTELEEPIFGMKVGFYLFFLPMLDAVKNHLFLLALICLAATVADAYLSFADKEINMQVQGDQARIGSVYRAVGVLLLVMALDIYIRRFQLMYSEFGAIIGPGWTDVHVRLPALTVMVAVTIIAGIAMFLPALRKLPQRWQWFRSLENNNQPGHAYVLTGLLAIVIGVQVVLVSLVPSMFQRLRVEPNEITVEKPYIAHNINFTRHGFDLNRVEEREFPVGDTFTEEMVEQNPSIFNNIRLWDWRALDAVYKQFQEIRLYYEFDDVDVDRYTIDGNYRQVMVSAREMELDNLPAQSQTFVNRRFKYTHGYGITMTNVSEFTKEGLPNLLILDIPPKSTSEDLTVERPEIYYGELTRTPVFVNTKEQEFDYPKGEMNAYTRYSGNGGVVMKNLWRKFLFSRKFDGMQLLLSGYPSADSRFMFHRQIKERANTLAPFLEFDDDPYITLVEGKLYWIIDAYTTSRFYPYSERFVPESRIIEPVRNQEQLYTESKLERFRGSNYVRNSVKVVVDAYEGSVDFYIFAEEDPLIRTWQRIFPDMFKEEKEMPGALRQHVRYPIDMLLLQGLVFAKYHMTDPEVFYNQEDLWVRATEKYYGQVQPVEPYYIMWELPGSDHPEFVLMQPFTPKNRQVSIGWIAGMCDGENYGRFLAYTFPKEKRVIGPQQVETKIDQDRFLSGQLSLWDQRGSRVIRGNVLAIPVEETLFYVEPIYLQAETAAYPELRLVVVMHDDRFSYGESFEEALQGLFEGADARPLANEAKRAETEMARSVAERIHSANEAFTEYLDAMGEKRYKEASESLQRLESVLDSLSREHGNGRPQ